MSTWESPRRFYRIRSSDNNASAAEETIIAMEYDDQSGTINVTWATVPNEKYQLESATYESHNAWEAAGETVTASREIAFLMISAGVDAHGKIYRVRKVE